MTSPYPDYVKTNLDWFSEAPSHWSLVKVAWHLPFVTGWTPSTSQAEYFEGENTWVSIEDMKSRVVSASKKNISDQAVSDRGMPLVPKGSLLFSFKLSVGKVAFAGIDLFTNEAIAAFLPNDHVSLKFLYYAAPIFLPKYGQNNIYGSLLMNRERIEKARTFVPPPHEQEIISNYLDREVGRIDDLVSEKKNFITLLKEKRQALISNVVTKGLDPNVELEDSGVEWIGEIPKHWDMIKFSHFVTIRNGQVDPKESPWCDYILIAPNHIESKSGKIIEKETAREQGAESGKYLCKKGEVIYSKIRPALAKACLSEDEEVICSADMYPMNCNHRMLNQYLLSLILSNEFTQLAILESGRVAMPKINRESLAQIKFPVPPISEQELAIEYIRSKTKRIDGLIEETKTSIDFLKEHRTALISAAVTGRIDLRDKEVA